MTLGVHEYLRPPTRNFTNELLCYLEASGLNLWWYSSKASDALPMLWLNQSTSTLSLVGDEHGLGIHGPHRSYEMIFGHRLDYDQTGLDDLETSRIVKLLSPLLDAAATGIPIAVVPFSSSRAIQNIAIAHQNVNLCGNTFQLEEMLNYKPWVERYLSDESMPFVNWKHVLSGTGIPSESQSKKIYRQPTGTGGLGHTLTNVSAADHGLSLWSIADYLPDATALNVSGCVFANGSIKCHPASIQIIGPPCCTDLQFGYCGNEFGTIGSYLDQQTINQIETMVVSMGRKLHSLSYLGIFGLDLLLSDNKILITELNPRFQASSILASYVLLQLGLPSVHEDHLAACLGLAPSEERMSVYDLSTEITVSQVFCYGSGAARNPCSPANDLPLDACIDLGVVGQTSDSNALQFRLITKSAVLADERTFTPLMQALLS